MAQVITSYEKAGQLILSIQMDSGKMILLDIGGPGAKENADLSAWLKHNGPNQLLVQGRVLGLGA